jgi:hypothetical protein
MEVDFVSEKVHSTLCLNEGYTDTVVDRYDLHRRKLSPSTQLYKERHGKVRIIGGGPKVELPSAIGSFNLHSGAFTKTFVILFNLGHREFPLWRRVETLGLG